MSTASAPQISREQAMALAAAKVKAASVATPDTAPMPAADPAARRGLAVRNAVSLGQSGGPLSPGSIASDTASLAWGAVPKTPETIGEVAGSVAAPGLALRLLNNPVVRAAMPAPLRAWLTAAQMAYAINPTAVRGVTMAGRAAAGTAGAIAGNAAGAVTSGTTPDPGGAATREAIGQTIGIGMEAARAGTNAVRRGFIGEVDEEAARAIIDARVAADNAARQAITRAAAIANPTERAALTQRATALQAFSDQSATPGMVLHDDNVSIAENLLNAASLNGGPIQRVRDIGKVARGHMLAASADDIFNNLTPAQAGDLLTVAVTDSRALQRALVSTLRQPLTAEGERIMVNVGRARRFGRGALREVRAQGGDTAGKGVAGTVARLGREAASTPTGERARWSHVANQVNGRLYRTYGPDYIPPRLTGEFTWEGGSHDEVFNRAFNRELPNWMTLKDALGSVRTINEKAKSQFKPGAASDAAGRISTQGREATKADIERALRDAGRADLLDTWRASDMVHSQQAEVFAESPIVKDIIKIGTGKVADKPEDIARIMLNANATTTREMLDALERTPATQAQAASRAYPQTPAGLPTDYARPRMKVGGIQQRGQTIPYDETAAVTQQETTRAAISRSMLDQASAATLSFDRGLATEVVDPTKFGAWLKGQGDEKLVMLYGRPLVQRWKTLNQLMQAQERRPESGIGKLAITMRESAAASRGLQAGIAIVGGIAGAQLTGNPIGTLFGSAVALATPQAMSMWMTRARAVDSMIALARYLQTPASRFGGGGTATSRTAQAIGRQAGRLPKLIANVEMELNAEADKTGRTNSLPMQ